jgi:hypothetical protein
MNKKPKITLLAPDPSHDGPTLTFACQVLTITAEKLEDARLYVLDYLKDYLVSTREAWLSVEDPNN